MLNFLIIFIMQEFFWDNFDSFYFIGIGGVSMSALAKFLLSRGKTVAGSDSFNSVYTQELKELGINVDIGDERGKIESQVVVYTDAINENDFQLSEAKNSGKKIISRGKLLYEISLAFNKVIAVSGCHGKTTCCAMLAHIFSCANKNFCSHIGGRDIEFSNFYYRGSEYFITEACEYKKNFLYLKPHVSVVLNSEPDHLECYGSAENLKNAYKNFANSAQISLAMCGDGIDCTADFGYQNTAQFYAADIKSDKGCYSFNVFNRDKKLGYIELSVYGKHNILNALAAISVAVHEGIDFENIHCGLKNFKGVERRFEQLGEVNEAKCIADYAHHPNEIKAAISSVENIYDGRLFVVFQPHTYSRTKNLFEEFVEVLSGLNNLLIYKTYSAREYFDDSGSALTLSQAIHKSKYGDDLQDIFEFISGVQRGDLVLFLGAGDIYDIAKSIIKKSNSI